MPALDDTTWTRRRLSTPFQLALSTFGILALELALIRWASGQVRVLAYFNNLILIGAFKHDLADEASREPIPTRPPAGGCCSSAAPTTCPSPSATPAGGR